MKLMHYNVTCHPKGVHFFNRHTKQNFSLSMDDLLLLQYKIKQKQESIKETLVVGDVYRHKKNDKWYLVIYMIDGETIRYSYMPDTANVADKTYFVTNVIDNYYKVDVTKDLIGKQYQDLIFTRIKNQK